MTVASLATDHINDLHKSGLTDSTIASAKIESLRPCDIDRELGMSIADVESAYRIPFDTDYSRFKLFYRKDADPSIKRPKYVQKRNAKNRLYIPLTMPESVLQGTDVICITEGEKKALKSCQSGIHCIAITGLWNWKIKHSDVLIPDFNRINLLGREVWLVPDSDWLDLGKDGRPRHLDDAVYRLATALMLKSAVVRIVMLPKQGDSKVGLDDYLLHHSAEDFQQLPRKTVTPRPCFRLEHDYLNYYGVTTDNGSNAKVFAQPERIAGAIEVLAYTRNGVNEDWGRMLSFRDKDAHRHSWAMPMGILAGNGTELSNELLGRGLPYISPKLSHRSRLLEYLQLAVPDKGRRARCVDYTGWHDNQFILPNSTIGATHDEVVYQGKAHAVVSPMGTADEWVNHIGRYCVGNSRLTFAVSMAFAAPLLHLVGGENAGMNIFGQSSTGKTTALRVACSVYGGSDYLQRWRATSNGLEGTATAHNDLLLGLDELAQVSSSEAGEIAYMLANGTGKQRANRGGDVRQGKRWRLLFLSTGEITLADHVAAGGKKVKAGQEVRLVDVPADTGKYGVFEELHSFGDPVKMANHFNQMSREYYGAVGIGWLEKICTLPTDTAKAAKIFRQQFIDNIVPAGADGQVSRVAGFFGLVSAAGEMATELGFTGWKTGDSTAAAATCFHAYLDSRGGYGAREADRVIEDVRLYIEQHGDSRFADLRITSDHERIINNRAGYRDAERSTYYILPAVFKSEVLKGHNERLAKLALIRAEILKPSSEKEFSTLIRPSKSPQIRAYAIDATQLLGGGENV